MVSRRVPRSARSIRKSKFQADLAPAEDRMVRSLKQDLQLGSNSDFLAEAIALYQWAVTERKSGRRLLSESAAGERKELLLPRLERVAPEAALPAVNIDWSRQELDALRRLSSAMPAEPTDKLVRAMRKQ